MNLPLTTGEYLTQSGDTATVDEVCTTAVFGKVNDTLTIWTTWGHTSQECNTLVRRVATPPNGVERRLNFNLDY